MGVRLQLDLPMPEIVALCERYPIRKLALFGSVLREDFRPDSDVDVLVEFETEARVSYFDLGALQLELEEIFNRDVHLVTPGALSPYFRQKIFDTAAVVYERA